MMAGFLADAKKNIDRDLIEPLVGQALLRNRGPFRHSTQHNAQEKIYEQFCPAQQNHLR